MKSLIQIINEQKEDNLIYTLCDMSHFEKKFGQNYIQKIKEKFPIKNPPKRLFRGVSIKNFNYELDSKKIITYATGIRSWSIEKEDAEWFTKNYGTAGFLFKWENVPKDLIYLSYIDIPKIKKFLNINEHVGQTKEFIANFKPGKIKSIKKIKDCFYVSIYS